MAAYVWQYATMLTPGRQKIISNTYRSFLFLRPMAMAAHYHMYAAMLSLGKTVVYYRDLLGGLPVNKRK